jgi:hypothetical protein
VSSRRTLKPRRGRGVASRTAAPPRPAPSPIGLLPAPFVIALVLGAALVLQARALQDPFFADDYLFLDQVRLRSLTAALTSPDPIGNFFRPSAASSTSGGCRSSRENRRSRSMP